MMGCKELVAVLPTRQVRAVVARRDRICEMMELMALWAGHPCPLRAESTELSMAGLEARATNWPRGVPVGTPQC